MDTKLLIFIVSALFVTERNVAQTKEDKQNALTYQTEMFGSAASGNYTPFWLVSNRNGMVPLEAGNAYLSAGLFYNQYFGEGFRWAAGADMAVVTPRYRNVFIRQLYAEIAYRSLLLTIGSKEQYNSLWDKELSSGDMVSSVNARPIPEAKISMPAYTLVPYTRDWLSVKGDFSVGRSFDTDYLSYFTKESHDFYVEDVLWHHKSLYFRIGSPGNQFPLSLELGLQHGAQWAGVSTNPRISVQPNSLSDFVRVITGREGGEGATVSDSINVLGNHYGSYDFKLTYKGRQWAVKAYHQRYFDDKSGTIFGNGWDGLWGIELDLENVSWLQKILVECLETRDQTGPFHFINFDHEKHPGVGGGADNYYNNGEYTTGLSYFSRAVGSPLLPSPEYNTDGSVGFKNTRIRDWHFGLSGALSPQVRYRMLFTFMDSWGTHTRPFLNKKTGTSGLLEITYQHPQMQGWLFTGSVGLDTGTVFGSKGAGFGLRIAKRGILSTRQKQ
ncbi:MAG: capsule assembly Wzi family protein [Tannerellaceae bacterium]|nr:capsule assembly Wzi family protein [Tannerellaceae bacterium]